MREERRALEFVRAIKGVPCLKIARSAASQLGEQRFAKLGASLAAILGEEEHQAPQRINIGTLVDLPPALLRCHQASLCEDRQVRREGALREARGIDEFAGGKAVGLVLHKQAECVEARGMGERGQGRQC